MRTPHSTIALAGFATAGLMLAGCAAPRVGEGAPRSAASQTASRTFAHQVCSNAGTYVVRWGSIPAPLPLNQPFDLQLEVRRASDGQLAAGVDLQVDAGMPAHGHGMNLRPLVGRDGPGAFTVRGLLFHMPGHWELYFDLLDGALLERAQADVELE